MNEMGFHDQVAVAAFSNALELNKEARILFDSGSYARATTLSILSMEEQVKAFAHRAVAFRLVRAQELKYEKGGRVRLHMLDHKTKDILFGLLYLNHFLLSEDIERIKAGKTASEATKVFRSLHGIRDMGKVFETMEDERLNSVYVGVEEGKSVVAPMEQFDREKCETFLRYSTELLSFWTFVFSLPKDKFLSLLQELSKVEDEERATQGEAPK